MPWASGRAFQVWRYGIGHSTLVLQSRPDDGECDLSITFEAVEFMRLYRSFPDLVLREAAESEMAEFPEIMGPPMRRLRLVLASEGRTGLVMCSRLVIRSGEASDEDAPVLFFRVATA